MRSDLVDRIINEVSDWDEVEAVSHRFGGVEFQFNGQEVGHIHRSGMVDIPFTNRLRIQLVEENLTGLHHLLKDTGWTTFYVRTEQDADHAIWLYKLSYLQKKHRASRYDAAQRASVTESLTALGLSADLRSAVGI